MPIFWLGDCKRPAMLSRSCGFPMGSPGATDITVLLRAWSGGNRQALEKLIPLVYQNLYAAAQHYMSHEAPGHILQNSALVNELYLQLAKLDSVDWQNRQHFYAVCAQLMRRILTTYARSHHRLKRGGDIEHIALEDTVTGATLCAQLVTLDDALQDLAAFDERMSKIVEFRAFVGLSVEETAHALNISERTVRRDWNLASAWLLRELSRGETK